MIKSWNAFSTFHVDQPFGLLGNLTQVYFIFSIDEEPNKSTNQLDIHFCGISNGYVHNQMLDWIGCQNCVYNFIAKDLLQ